MVCLIEHTKCRNASQYPSFEPDCPNEHKEVLAQGAVGPVVVADSHLATRYTVTVMDGPNKAIHAQVPVLVMDLL